MHAVHTYKRLGVPLTMARTRWMFGFQRRFVRTWECDTDMPHEGPLPQTSHTAAIVIPNFVELTGDILSEAPKAPQASYKTTSEHEATPTPH